MNSVKTIFSQLKDFLSPYEFRKCVERYGGNIHDDLLWDHGQLHGYRGGYCQLAPGGWYTFGYRLWYIIARPSIPDLESNQRISVRGHCEGGIEFNTEPSLNFTDSQCSLKCS